MAIRCCKDCVKPKRYPGCHDHCQEYQAEKAELDTKMKEERMRHPYSVYEQKMEGVERAYKRNRGKKRG